MNLSYALDPDLIELNDSRLDVHVKNLFDAILIIDQSGVLENIYIKKIKEARRNNPLMSVDLDPYLFPEINGENAYHDFRLEKKIRANCDYNNNFINYICGLVKMNFYIDFVLTTEKNKHSIINELSKLKGVNYPKFMTEKKQEDMSQNEKKEEGKNYDLIEEYKNRKFSIPQDEENFYKFMTFSNYIEISLREWPQTTFVRSFDPNNMLDTNEHINFEGPLKKYENNLKSYNYLHSTNDIVES